MKQKIILSLTSFALGFMLILTALVPLSISFHVPCFIGLVGFILLLVALIYGLKKIYDGKRKDAKLISSRLTPLYKFYLPITFFSCLLFNTLMILLNIYPGDDVGIFVALEIMFIIWLTLALPFSKLYEVYLDNNQIIITNFLNESILQTNCVISVKRYFLVLYRLKIVKETGTQKIIFLPHFLEFSYLVTPKSIKELKSRINY